MGLSATAKFVATITPFPVVNNYYEEVNDTYTLYRCRDAKVKVNNWT